MSKTLDSHNRTPSRQFPLPRSTFCSLGFAVFLGFAIWNLELSAFAFLKPERPPLPEVDVRVTPLVPPVSEIQRDAVRQLTARLPQVKVDFHSLLGSPALVSARERFLTGSNGTGGAIPSAVNPASADPY